MGRHDDESRRRRDDREAEEERLLRKAREYVEKHKDEDDRDQNKRSKNKTRHDEHRHSKKSDRKRDRRDSEERSRKRHRKEDRHHRSSDDEDVDRHHRRSRMDDKKKRKKKDSKRKHEKESRHRKHGSKRVSKSNLYPLGDMKGSPPAELLDVKRDYFAFHQHLWVFLYREEGVVFGDLSSEDAHSAFKRFVKRYNTGELEVAYYDRLPTEAVEECKTTNHKWKFHTSETERKSLQYLQEGVRKQTEYEGTKTESVGSQKEAVSSSNVPRLPTNERRPPTQEERLADRAANRRLRDHVRTAEEELSGGRKDGRERQIEKRMERAEAIHGAAKDREDARMGGVELNDEAIYGGGDADFRNALAHERQRNAQREQKKQGRVAELKKKEQDKQEQMIKMLGLQGIKPGQKIQIAPRKDT